MTPSLSIEFKITTIFLIHAIIATFLGLPAANNRCYVCLNTELLCIADIILHALNHSDLMPASLDFPQPFMALTFSIHGATVTNAEVCF